MKTVTAVLVGIGGYGNTILKNCLHRLEEFGIRLVGTVDPNGSAAPMWEELQRLAVPHYKDLQDFYAEHSADLAILCTPIQFHERQAILAMEKGSDVLCEKPTAATLSQSAHMAQVAQRTGRQLHIGFQLSYVPAVWRLKQDIMDGVFGKPLTLSSLVCWPRNGDYYARSWCAKLKWKGEYVLDSIAMNACAHYLHLMYFLLGDTMATSAMPEAVEAILCRANAIETFDTAMLQACTKGAKLQFLATHACEKRINPTMRFEFENAVVDMTEGEEENAIRARFRDGRVKDYGAVRPDFFHKVPYCADAVRGLVPPVCTPETAEAHLKTVNAVTELVPVLALEGIVNEKNVTVVPGMDAWLEEAFSQGKMPWELTDCFGSPTRLELKDYIWRGTL